MGVLRLTKERQSIRCERDTALWRERCGIITSPWEMHSSGQSRLRARRPNARIIVLEYLPLTTSYGILLDAIFPLLQRYYRVDFKWIVWSFDGNLVRCVRYIGWVWISMTRWIFLAIDWGFADTVEMQMCCLRSWLAHAFNKCLLRAFNKHVSTAVPNGNTPIYSVAVRF